MAVRPNVIGVRVDQMLKARDPLRIACRAQEPGFVPSRHRVWWSRCLSVFVDQAAEDVGPFDALAGILVSDESLPARGGR